jgi:hypothetical protein
MEKASNVLKISEIRLPEQTHLFGAPGMISIGMASVLKVKLYNGRDGRLTITANKTRISQGVRATQSGRRFQFPGQHPSIRRGLAGFYAQYEIKQHHKNNPQSGNHTRQWD